MNENIVDATDASKLVRNPTPPIGGMVLRGAEILFFENIADAVAYPLRSERYGPRRGISHQHIQEESENEKR